MSGRVIGHRATTIGSRTGAGGPHGVRNKGVRVAPVCRLHAPADRLLRLVCLQPIAATAPAPLGPGGRLLGSVRGQEGVAAGARCARVALGVLHRFPVLVRVDGGRAGRGVLAAAAAARVAPDHLIAGRRWACRCGRGAKGWVSAGDTMGASIAVRGSRHLNCLGIEWIVIPKGRGRKEEKGMKKMEGQTVKGRRHAPARAPPQANTEGFAAKPYGLTFRTGGCAERAICFCSFGPEDPPAAARKIRWRGQEAKRKRGRDRVFSSPARSIGMDRKDGLQTPSPPPNPMGDAVAVRGGWQRSTAGRALGVTKTRRPVGLIVAQKAVALHWRAEPCKGVGGDGGAGLGGGVIRYS